MEVWKRKQHTVSSLIRHPGPTPGAVLFAVGVLERIQHRRTPAFAKSGAFQMVITCSLELQPNHHPLSEGTCFLWQPVKLLYWGSILFDQISPLPSLSTRHFDTAHPDTGSTVGKLVVKEKSNNKGYTHISSNMAVWEVIGNLVIWLYSFP